MTDFTLTILGCGGSTAVPTIGNRWGQCDPDEPKNRRLRPSALVKTADTSVLIDTGPDLRQQFNRVGQDDLDAVLYTHAHADHINGLDELRPLSLFNRRVFELYGNEATLSEIERRFDYMFTGSPDGFYKPHVVSKTINGPFSVGDIDIQPIEQQHGNLTSIGYRFGNVAYSTDVSDLDDAALAALEGLDTWIIDAGNSFVEDRSPVHANVQQIEEWGRMIKPRMTYLTHLTLFMDYRTCIGRLPENIVPAHDGLVIDGRM